MAGQYGPKLITSGLTLYLNAGDKNSYRGTGTIWRDLAQGLEFNSQGTQTPFVTVNNVSCFDFNASGYWQCSVGYQNVDLAGDCTVIFWYYHQATSVRGTIFQKNGTVYFPYQQELAVSVEVYDAFTYYSRYSATGVGYDKGDTSANTINSWNMMALKMSTGKTTTARTGFYSKNGAPWTAYYTSNTSTAIVAAADILVGSGYAGAMPIGYISAVLCYNRMLDDSEIKQNYNCMESQYRL